MHAAWIDANPDGRRAHLKKYDSSERGRVNRKLWEAANADQQREYKANQYRANRDVVIARAAKWAEENRERRNEISRSYAATENGRKRGLESRWRRIAREHAAEGSFTVDQFISLCEQTDWRCLACLKTFDVLEADHVVALSTGGANDISNIQPLCRTCNAAKGAAYRDYRPEFVCQPTDLLAQAA